MGLFGSISTFHIIIFYKFVKFFNNTSGVFGFSFRIVTGYILYPLFLLRKSDRVPAFFAIFCEGVIVRLWFAPQ